VISNFGVGRGVADISKVLSDPLAHRVRSLANVRSTATRATDEVHAVGGSTGEVVRDRERKVLRVTGERDARSSMLTSTASTAVAEMKAWSPRRDEVGEAVDAT